MQKYFNSIKFFSMEFLSDSSAWNNEKYKENTNNQCVSKQYNKQTLIKRIKVK